ncbi:unnamed protein product [Ilex paraguariensis]|uniref:WD repeat-containing protein 6 n=1 Tax=Ilex paraguariensis TaxID=185542 RepID=A0ABC8RL29_9AQUA
MAGRSSEWRLQRGQYLGEISALCFLHPPPSVSCLPYLLAGTGSQLLLYDLVTGVMIRSFQVFEGIRVHGISLEKFHQQSSSSALAVKIAVFGERKVKMFCLRVEIVNNSQNKPQVSMVDLILLLSLPKLNHWVLDVRFLKDSVSSSHEESQYLAIGCSDNSVCFWNILRSDFIFEVRCSEKCLLYSMRMWGDEVEALRVASGTIYNEVIVWKVVRQNHAPFVESAVKHLMNPTSEEGEDLPGQQYEALHICKMLGHEGSIFRIAWSSNGSKLASVSDDRSARIWAVHAERSGAKNSVGDDVSYSMGPVLFGHSARVWDCCIFDSLIITAGEDCTCRLWQLDGTQLRMIKDHIGRGIWRCFKSEYVRCLHFTREDTLYVATNNGHLYHAKLSTAGDVKWTKLVRVSGEVPIVCMNLISTNSSDDCHGIDDWVAVGDGKGSMTIVRVVGNVWTPKVGLVFTWSAEIGRQLLGTYWCRSLGFSFIFSADPKGKLKLWRLCDPLQTASDNNTGSHNATLVAEFVSCFGVRIVCLDASLKEEVLVCGDLRGNLILFPLLKGLLLGSYIASEAKISPSNHFKGAHGISSVCSVAIAGSSFSQVEIHSVWPRSSK